SCGREPRGRAVRRDSAPRSRADGRTLMRWIKYGAIALVVVVVALVVVVATMDLGRFKGYAEEAAMNATGRKLSIDGELHLSLFPAPTLSAEKVRFANASWGSAPDMVKVEKVE